MPGVKKEISETNYLKIFLLITFGFLIVSLIFPFAVNHFFSDWSKSGTFGDTFGASNALFSGLALAGVIVTILVQKKELENQRLELQLQRTEMQETRKEFLITRTTNLVYNQLDRFQKCLNEFTITHSGNTYIGNDAVSFLDKHKEIVGRFPEDTDEDYDGRIKDAIINQLKLFQPNKSNIEKFAHNAYNSVEVLKRIIYKTNLEIEELNDIKNLFFVNIGFINMGVIERISDVADKELTYLSTNDYLENNLEVGSMMRADIFLGTIVKYYHQRLTKDNIEELKHEWIKHKGSGA